MKRNPCKVRKYTRRPRHQLHSNVKRGKCVRAANIDWRTEVGRSVRSTSGAHKKTGEGECPKKNKTQERVSTPLGSKEKEDRYELGVWFRIQTQWRQSWATNRIVPLSHKKPVTTREGKSVKKDWDGPDG